MQVFAFLLVSFACQGHGRRMHVAMESSSSSPYDKPAKGTNKSPGEHKGSLPVAGSDKKSPKDLGSLLLALNPVGRRSARLQSRMATGGLSSGVLRSGLHAEDVTNERRKPVMSTSHDDFGDEELSEQSNIPQRSPFDRVAPRPPNHRKGLLERFEERKGLLNTKVLVGMLAFWSLGFLGVSSASAADLGIQVSEEAGNSGFLQSFLLIFASEIGDKTFFIAGLLAAKYSRLISLVGSIGALGAMTVISVIIGRVFHSLPDGLTQGLPLDDYAAVAAFAYFGLKTLYDAYQLPEGDSSGIEEEQRDAEEEVAQATKGNDRSSTLTAILQTFGLVFAAEVGDRSFFTTIALSAALNPFAVAFGAIAGHGFATGIAVAGGSLMSKYLSEKVIGYIGGSLFLVFAITTAFGVF